MNSTARLTALFAAAMLAPGVAAAAEPAGDASSMFLGDQELGPAPNAGLLEFAAVALDLADALPTAEPAPLAYQMAEAPPELAPEAAPVSVAAQISAPAADVIRLASVPALAAAAPSEAPAPQPAEAPVVLASAIAPPPRRPALEPRPVAEIAAAGETLQVAELTSDELGGQRGGFMTPLGIDIGFGAVVRTSIDGVLALETKMVWTEFGPQTTQNFGSQPASSAEAAAVAEAGRISLGPAANWSGIVEAGDGGATAILHDLSDNAISSLVVNTANNRTITQQTEITLAIPDFAAVQAEMFAQQAQLRIEEAMGSAITNALPR